MKWTNKQARVIDSRNKNLLVSAAAGSGKTAVLVERIKKIIIEDGVDVRELLVVTFTKAAASEMKEKIANALEEAAIEHPDNAEYMLRQLDRIDGANISTFDSFAQRIVHNYFYVKDIEPGLSVCDESESSVLQREAIDKTFEDFFESHDRDFIDFLDAYSSAKNDENLKDSLLNLYSKIRSFPFGVEELKEMIDGLSVSESSFLDGSLGVALEKSIRAEINIAAGYFEKVYDLISEYEDLSGLAEVAKTDLEKINALKEMNFTEIEKSINELKYGTFSKKLKGPSFELIEDRIKNYRDKKGKERIKSIKKKYFSHSLEEMVSSINATRKMAEVLYKILNSFEGNYAGLKADKGLMDFADGIYFAIDILENEDVAKEVREKFKYIFIDEYQDSNYLQERLISLIKRENNLFMVGDIKQSIYRFRMAEPVIFKDRYESYSKFGNREENEDCEKAEVKYQTDEKTKNEEKCSADEKTKNEDRCSANENEKTENRENGKSEEKGKAANHENDIDEEYLNSERIDLNDNFRSKIDVINFVNAIFEELMEDYTDEVALHEGNPYKGDISYKTQLHIVNNKTDDDYELHEDIARMKEKELEARAAADVIQNSLGDMIYDAKKDVTRPLEERDIVVLLGTRSSGMTEYYNALMDIGVDAYIVGSEGYFDTMEVMTFMDLLKVIDNSKQDIPLLSVLRSEIFGFNVEELIKIRVNCKTGSFYNAFVGYDEVDEIKLKIETTLACLEKWSRQSKYMRVDEFVWMLMKESRYYALSGTLPGGRQRQANLRVLVEKSREVADKNDGKLRDFLKYTENMSLKKVRVPQASLAGEGDDTVKIMTIHNSKGLEYPMVVVGGLSHRLNFGKHGDWSIDKDIGVGLREVNVKEGYSRKTILQKLIEEKHKREELEEYIRVLYVACTRAKDRLVLLAGDKDWNSNKEDLSEETGNPKSYLEMIYPVLLNKKDAGDIIIHEKRDMEYIISGMKSAGTRELKLLEIKEYEGHRDERLKRFVDERLSYVYPFEGEVAKSKYSVSELSNRDNEFGNVEITLRDSDIIKADKKIKDTDFGTVMHLVMQHIDFKKALKSVSYAGVNDDNEDSFDGIKKKIPSIKDIVVSETYIEDFIEQMKKNGTLNDAEASLVNPGKIRKFFESDIGRRAASADVVKKEQPFNMIYQDADGEKMVQGVIDCFFEEDGRVVLIDYKTNANTKGIEQRYNRQIDLYSKAIEQSLGMEVKEAYLYLFKEDKAVKMIP